jgi:prolyl-tRNA synthetase
MKYQDLHIQTQREFPNNARTQSFGWLVRAGYLTRENEIQPLGQQMISRLQDLSGDPSFFSFLPILSNEKETFFPLESGSTEIIHCPACNYTERIELAQFKKTPYSQEDQLPVEKVLTPDCHTIEALANFLNLPKEKTAKALMYTRPTDNQFVFVVVRGDMQMSEAKLKNLVGDFCAATAEEISAAGATAGYASPVGLNAKRALIVVDDLVPQSPNLAAGANEAGYHLLNTNCGRDYSPAIVADLIQAKAGDACVNCGKPLSTFATLHLATRREFHFENILLALAETYHDDKGLTFPKSAAAFDVYLMQAPGKQLDTRAKAKEIYEDLQTAGISVLFDDRDECAGVKFNDADLIGCPIRITVGEKALQNGMVELKPRTEKENRLVQI